jgi:hypothetical protein
MRYLRATVFAVAFILFLGGIGQADSGGITQKGKYVVWYDGPELKAELIYRWANDHLGDEWLVLKLSITSDHRSASEVSRSSITIRTPDGRTLPLMDQKAFREIYPEVRVALERIDAWGPPVRRLDSFNWRCEFWFLAPPFSTGNRESLRLNPGSWCNGPLVFRPPAGVQPGRWVLVIDLEESQARIPFELEADGKR